MGGCVPSGSGSTRATTRWRPRRRRRPRRPPRDGLRRGEQRRRAGAVELRLAAGGEEREHVLALLAGSVGHGHEALGKQVAALALRAEAPAAPEDKGTELALSMVIGWLDAFDVDERPQCGAVVEDVGARAGESVDSGRDRTLEHGLDLCAHRSHPRKERRAVERARFVVVPVVEQQPGVVEELPPELAGGPGALGERHVSAQEAVSYTHLT